MIRIWRVYQNALHVHPIRTAAFSAGSLMALGDAIAQTVLEKKTLTQYDPHRTFRFLFFGTVLALTRARSAQGTLLSLGDLLAQFVVEKRSLQTYDSKRTLRFAIFGTFFAGPMFSVWYGRLAHTFGHAKYATVKMVACDQLLFAPPFLAYFLGGMEILKGEGLEAIKNKLIDDYPDVMKTNYKIWPAVQAINFTFVPVHYRVLVVNIVAVGWNTYLAWMSEKVHDHEHDHDVPEHTPALTEAADTSSR